MLVDDYHRHVISLHHRMPAVLVASPFVSNYFFFIFQVYGLPHFSIHLVLLVSPRLQRLY